MSKNKKTAITYICSCCFRKKTVRLPNNTPYVPGNLECPRCHGVMYNDTIDYIKEYKDDIDHYENEPAMSIYKRVLEERHD